MILRTKKQRGMTAVEVLVASMLSALLMVAVMGTLRGLKAHERALDLRDPTASWHRSLIHVLQEDLNNARSMRVGPQYFELEAIAGHQEGAAVEAWLPVVIRYEIHRVEDANWLVRRETQDSHSTAQLACEGITALRINRNEIVSSNSDKKTGFTEMPIVDGLTIELLEDNGKTVLSYEFHKL
jgi:prepilin-type N-terminal cleavage/methylation domain-containing protein